MATKLGYTWYPKDWGNSESVFEMNLCERGLYRELIDLAMLNDNKTEIKIEVWSRKFAITVDDLNTILSKLIMLSVIIVNEDKTLFIPSCEPRLNLSRGGKKSKPTETSLDNLTKPTPKPTPKPTSKPISEQIESKEKQNKKEIEYKSFMHLCLNEYDFDKLNEEYSKEQIDSVLESIENYKLNKNYVSLYLTAKKWLKKEYPKGIESEENINFDKFISFWNDLFPKKSVKGIQLHTKKRYNELIDIGYSQEDIANAMKNAKRDDSINSKIDVNFFSFPSNIDKYKVYKPLGL